MYMSSATVLFLLSWALTAPVEGTTDSIPAHGIEVPLTQSARDLAYADRRVWTSAPWTFEKTSQILCPVSYYQKAAINIASATKKLGVKGVLRTFEGGGVFHLDARKDRLAISYDMCYGRLKSRTPNSISPPLIRFNAPVKDSIDCGILVIETSYRFGNGALTFDTLLGLRYLDAVASFSIEYASLDIDRGFMEPSTGGILRLRLSDAWELSARGAVSGFSLGSEVTFDVEPRITYTVSKDLSIFVGFRIMKAHYHEEASGLVSLGVGPYRVPDIIYGHYKVDAEFDAAGISLGFIARW
jgi:hypothetical protein